MQSRAGGLIKGLEAAESGQKSKIGLNGKVWCAVALRTGHFWGISEGAACQLPAASNELRQIGLHRQGTLAYN